MPFFAFMRDIEQQGSKCTTNINEIAEQTLTIIRFCPILIVTYKKEADTWKKKRLPARANG